MKKIGISIIILAICVGLLQFLGTKEPESTPAKDLSGIPVDINAIIRKSCFDCHSNQTNLKWYDKLTPANFIVYSHIQKGRKALNFTKWDSLTKPAQNSLLYYSVNKIIQGEMPLKSYTFVHPNAKLTDKDIQILKHYLLDRTPRKQADSIQIAGTKQQLSDFFDDKMALSKQSVQPAPNGIEYIPIYRNWKVISISDRFDNGTMRIIYTNNIGFEAIQEKNTNPWPDGTVIAKAAWKEYVNENGSISSGQFSQVEFMIKDSHKYASTEGWGWARWKGTDLKPYGEKATFSSECISCHRPMKNNDFVFTKPIYFRK